MKHKELRKFIKKIRRKKIRQKNAIERDKKLEEEQIARLNDPNYITWLKEQEIFEKCKEQKEKIEQQLREKEWLERDRQLQIQFHYEQERKNSIEAIKKIQREKIQKAVDELKNLERQKEEEKNKMQKEMIRKQQEMFEKLELYIGGKGKIPDEFNIKTESNPGKELCPFFSKTAACRHGHLCSKNHISSSISHIILLRNFFQHILFNEIKNTEYGNDILLEFTESELNRDYAEFFDDIVDELEKFGKINNIRTSQNCLPHLRGNVYVEYDSERSAMKAFLNLQGRFYASKQINVEFCTLLSWKSAVCGLSFSKKCTKGKFCNYLHILKNPGDKYNKPLRHNYLSLVQKDITKLELLNSSWNDIDKSDETRNWRWSESPERESLQNFNRNESENREQYTEHHSKSLRSSRSISIVSSNDTSGNIESSSKRIKKRKKERKKSKHKKRSTSSKKIKRDKSKVKHDKSKYSDSERKRSNKEKIIKS